MLCCMQCHCKDDSVTQGRSSDHVCRLARSTAVAVEIVQQTRSNNARNEKQHIDPSRRVSLSRSA